jgi:hypothetical protein
LYQQFRVLFRSFAVDDFQHEFVFGIQRNVIPVVATPRVSRIVFRIPTGVSSLKYHVD